MKKLLEKFLSYIDVHEPIKEALLLQLISPEPINILLVGDLGTAKTTILKEVAHLKEKSRYCVGAYYTPPFTPSIFLKGSLAEVSLLCFDKIDRGSKEDRYVLVDIIDSGTAILGAANPKFGRFDPYDLIAYQIDLPPSLIISFDLIFPLKDMPNREKDAEVASLILNENIEKAAHLQELKEMLRQYNNFKVPTMTSEAKKELTDYYIAMRNTEFEKGIPLAITHRQLVSLVKLSKAAATVRFSPTVSKEDAHKAINLMDFCLHQIARDPEMRRVDIDRLSSNITATQRTTLSIIKEIINILEKESISKNISVESITAIAQKKNIAAEEVEVALEKLRRSRDIFEPKEGFIQRI